MVKLTLKGDFLEVIDGALLLCEDYSFSLCDDGLEINVIKTDSDNLSAAYKDGIGTIYYSKKCHFFRALGLFLEAFADGKNEFLIKETARFDTNGVMADVSQGNAVINSLSIKKTLRQMAIMGMNMFMVYSEDNHVVEGQPYFGYMRPKYTENELREFDNYADTLGIEMIPCIQTLAHLQEVLKWPVYKNILDDNSTLLVGEEKTYDFIKDVILASSRPFKTKRIHIGMDEAWHLGHGQYFVKNGYVNPTQIMKAHLARVMEIVTGMGLVPMMWSDMFFRALSENGINYYNRNLVIPPETVESVPENISLIYWDYYHYKDEEYEDYINQHRVLGEPIFAGGILSYIGFAPHWEVTFGTSERALLSCKKLGVREVFLTTWGDNGTEAPFIANMPGIQFYAEHGYCDTLDQEKFKKRFAFCCGAELDDFLALELLDKVPGTPDPFRSFVNPSKCFMWQDIMTGLFDIASRNRDLENHYTALAERFEAAKLRNGYYSFMFDFYTHVASTLAVKSEAGNKLTDAYLAGDRAKMSEIANVLLPEVSARIQKLRKIHRELWFSYYKTLGWDILDLRYGGVIARIETAIYQTMLYVDGKVDRLDELEEARLSPDPGIGNLPYSNYYERISTPSRISTYGYGI